ncbi:MAG: hypothetical protein CSA20_01890 [Deltaproteobacteria bacterium]|nr:MAG: hypothetical protein CSA20_01890 [Deltaproteobacteria bacterium]
MFSEIELVCLLLLATACITDFTRRIIPNALTVSACLGGLCYHTLSYGQSGLYFSLYGLLLGGALLLPAYARGWTGGGDVKLLAALGAWAGFRAGGNIFLYSTICGGIMALGQILRKRTGRQPQRRRGSSGRTAAFAQGHKGPSSTADTMPYALAIGCGYLVYLLFGGVL